MDTMPVVAPVTPVLPLDFMVRVNRSEEPKDLHFTIELLHPELEFTGPSVYDLQASVRQWLHDGQKNRKYEHGNIIYEFLKATNSLAFCLNLQDGIAIQKMSIAIFCTLFGGNSVFLWASVRKYSDGKKFVPCLYAENNQVVLNWVPLTSYWNRHDVALRFI